MKHRRYLPSAIGLAVLSLTGCNSSDDQQEYLDASDIQYMKGNQGSLVKASTEQAALTIKNGMYLSQFGYNYDNCNQCELAATTDGVAEDTSGGSSRYSTTTTQEQGVAESDRVKYDGDNLYLASNKYNYYHQQSDQSNAFIRVMDRNSDNSLAQASSISLPSNASGVEDLYLFNKQLAAIYNVYDDISAGFTDNSARIDAIDIWYPYQNKFGLSFFDATQSNDVTDKVNYTIDGYVLSSRRIDDKVYVVSSYSPYWQIDTYPETTSEQQQAYQNIIDSEDNSLLPSISYGDTTEPLVSLDNCYLPSGSQSIDGYSSVVTLTTFDINQPNQRQSLCILAPIQGFYASPSSIYFYSTVYPDSQENSEQVAKTQIHQFEFTTDSADYVASGAVEGTLGWSNPHLRFNERNGHLRVVSTDWYGADAPEHKLSVLQTDRQQNTLSLVSQLPNEQQPAKIGKPGEDIYAVRYFADKAYVVTFRRRDPLYVIDLADPTAPTIQGELDIPGYSAYLQPLNENLILGIGQQLDDNANGLEPVQDSDIIEGAKAELYDVSDPTSPQVVGTIVYENGYSPVEYDYHALTQLQISDEEYRVAFPVVQWQRNITTDGSYSWDYVSSMELLEVDLTTPELKTNGHLQVESDYYGSWGDRAIIHGDVIYYVKDNQVWQSSWSTPNTLLGPY